MHFGSRTVEVTDDRGHTSLVSHCCRKMDWCLGIILREALDLGSSLEEGLAQCWKMDGSPFLGVSKRAFAGGRPMNHDEAPQTFGETSRSIVEILDNNLRIHLGASGPPNLALESRLKSSCGPRLRLILCMY